MLLTSFHLSTMDHIKKTNPQLDQSSSHNSVTSLNVSGVGKSTTAVSAGSAERDVPGGPTNSLSKAPAATASAVNRQPPPSTDTKAPAATAVNRQPPPLSSAAKTNVSYDAQKSVVPRASSSSSPQPKVQGSSEVPPAIQVSVSRSGRKIIPKKFSDDYVSSPPALRPEPGIQVD